VRVCVGFVCGGRGWVSFEAHQRSDINNEMNSEMYNETSTVREQKIPLRCAMR
jgi:hypothetical protein